MERTGKHIIELLSKKWRVQSIAFCFLLALAFSILIAGLLHAFDQWSLWSGIPVFFLSLALLLFLFPYWHINASEVSRFLNRRYPELEESCGLLLQPEENLNFLEKLQVKKVGNALVNLHLPHPLKKKLGMAALSLLGACIISAGAFVAVNKSGRHVEQNKPAAPEKSVPGIASVNISISAPAYTRKPVRTQNHFDLRAEEGASVRWEINTTEAIPALQLVFNDTSSISFHAENDEHTHWSLTRQITHSGFYQLKWPDKLSGLFQAELIPDEPPLIYIQTPGSYTVIDYGEPEKLPLRVSVKDDYAVQDAYITATIASGSGEAVKFHEQKISFSNSFSGSQPEYDLNKTIDLVALGMHPGDELYFYIKARDNHSQESRSDMYIVSLPDTAQLMDLEGIVLPMDVKTEYFRSQRQIIIETEQLLREKDTINLQTFKNRSNELGLDQKVLRLRYGKFLGEESEEGVENPGPDQTAKDPKDFGNAQKVLDQFTDKHDNAEDAGFFEPEIKKQLKATLTEMWNAELQLRTFKPREALPYEYKALRLLKDLQQKSRAYVAKTGIKTTTPDPAKRLTGDLSGIKTKITERNHEEQADSADMIRIALAILNRLKTEPVFTDAPLAVLREAGGRLGKEAAARPSIYLNSYQAIKRIMQALDKRSIPVPSDLVSAGQALQKIIAAPAASPRSGKIIPDLNLSQQYFDNLSANKKQP